MGLNLCTGGAPCLIQPWGALTAWGLRFPCGLPRFEFLEITR